MSEHNQPEERIDQSKDVDAATVEIARNYFVSAAEEMKESLIRTAYNSVIYSIWDFGISLYDADLNLVADSPGLTIFLGANDFAIKKGVEYVGRDNFNPGDVVMMNYPYWSSSHTFDAMLFSPIFRDPDVGEDLIGFAACRGHLVDMGQMEGAYQIDTMDIHQEGLKFPGQKIWKEGEADEEILDIIRFNNRAPELTMGDIHAQVASLRTGEKRYRELYDQFGAETVEECIDEIIEHGDRTTRNAIEDLPDGSWTAVDYLDGTSGTWKGVERDLPDGKVATDGLVRVEVEVTIDGDEMTFDFSGSDDQVPGPINSPLGLTKTTGKICAKMVTTPHSDSNEGEYKALEVIAPKGNVFNAEPPAAVGTIWGSILAIDITLKALAKAVPDRVPASTGGDCPNVFLYGTQPDTGKYTVDANNDALGYGAGHDHDGGNALKHYNQNNTQNVPVEVIENKTPIRYVRYELRQDSAGPGRHRGGLGIRRDWVFTHPFDSLSTFQKTRTHNYGVKGGKASRCKSCVCAYLHPDDNWDGRINAYVDNNDIADTYLDKHPDWLADKDKQYVALHRGEYKAGEGISIRTSGGGGYGDPYRRPPKAVLEDVLDGYVSKEKAREEYGVVITDDDKIDEEATEELREDPPEPEVPRTMYSVDTPRSVE
jgi:N-methylhydantoinase B